MSDKKNTPNDYTVDGILAEFKDGGSEAGNDDFTGDSAQSFETEDKGEFITEHKVSGFTGADGGFSEPGSAANGSESNSVSDETENAEKPETRTSITGFFLGLLPSKGDGLPEIIRKLVFLVAVLVFAGAGVMLASTLIQSHRAVEDLKEIKASVTTTLATATDNEGNIVTVPPTSEEIKSHNERIMDIYSKYEDVVGFIEIGGCDIYQPVVQGLDNKYYLTHTYYDKQNKGGAIFMDFRCTFTNEYASPNIVLYGHNERDGTMFGNLKHYKTDNNNGYDTGFYTENHAVTLRSSGGADTYLIYAYFVTNALEKQDKNGEVFHYHDYIETLKDKNTFDWYYNEVMERTQIISPVGVEYGDELLLLSTCSNEFSDSRFVVCARKLRENESISEIDFTAVTPNYNARGLDWEAIMSGVTPAGPAETAETEDTAESETQEETSETEETTAPEETTEITSEETETAAAAISEETTVLTDENGMEITTVTTTKFVKPTTVSKKVDATKNKTTTTAPVPDENEPSGEPSGFDSDNPDGTGETENTPEATSVPDGS